MIYDSNKIYMLFKTSFIAQWSSPASNGLNWVRSFPPHLYLITEVEPAFEMLCTLNAFKMMDSAHSSINTLNRSPHIIAPYILNHPLSWKAVISRDVVKPWQQRAVPQCFSGCQGVILHLF